MNFFYIILIILTILFIIILLKKNFSNRSSYQKESIDILTKTFGEQNFSQNGDIFQLQEKLHIKYTPQNNYEKSILTIIESTKHKQDVIYKNNMSHNKPFEENTTFQILTNEIIDFSIKKNINLKGSIRLLFLSLNNKALESLIDDRKQEKEYIKLFYKLLPSFVTKFNKKLAE
ncbi:MAG: hypothetical protein K8R39_06100 [Arcobacteraceae bacterium]|nr:hypothetical protein [Arcobacteraceae bacterium]